MYHGVSAWTLTLILAHVQEDIQSLIIPILLGTCI